jgi:hypothetical protein
MAANRKRLDRRQAAAFDETQCPNVQMLLSSARLSHSQGLLTKLPIFSRTVPANVLVRVEGFLVRQSQRG